MNRKTERYEIRTEDGRIIASCRCGLSGNWPDKGLGRAIAATWQTQHQDCA